MWFRVVATLSIIAMLGLVWVLISPARVAPPAALPPAVQAK